MAAFLTGALGANLNGATLVAPVSVQSDWQVIHNDLTQAAETTALLRPATAGTTYPILMAISPHCTGVLLCGRYPQASTLTGSNPVVRIIGINGPAPLATQGTILDDGTYHWTRIDGSGVPSAAGITISIGTTNDFRDTTYRYTAPYSLTRSDLQGCQWLLALTETAAGISAGSMQLMAKPLN